MMQSIKDTARFLRLIDENNELSITYIAVWIVLIKLAMTQDVNIIDASTVMIALMNYSGKKVINYFTEQKKILNDEQAVEIKRVVEDCNKRVQQLQDKVGAVQAAQSVKKLF